MPYSHGHRRETIEPELLNKLIEEAAELGFKQICFTGGEPFLKRDMLKKAIECCDKLGRTSSVMTNAYWAKTRDDATRVLGSLRGINHLGMSADVFHEKYIPLERIKFGIMAANDLGISCSVRVAYQTDPGQEVEEIRGRLAEVAGLYQIEMQPIQAVGRADNNKSISFFEGDAAGTPCQSADVHAVNYDGKVYACCGASVYWGTESPLLLGDLHSAPLAEVMTRAQLNPVLHALRLWGPRRVYEIARHQGQSNGIAIPRSDETSICAMCKAVCGDALVSNLATIGLSNKELRRDLAYGRLVELGETDMLIEEATASA